MPAGEQATSDAEPTSGDDMMPDETATDTPTGDELAASAGMPAVDEPSTPELDMAANSWSGEAPGFEASTRDFGSDADVMDDAFSSPVAPPEWPAADLVRDEAQPEQEASADIAAAYAAVTDEPEEMDDAGDDSDAPIELDADTIVRADAVNLSQGGAQSIEATTVTVSQSGAGRINADEVTVEQSGVGLARTGNLTLGNGASAFAVVADQATVEEGSNAFLVISRSFAGDVKPTIDWRVAMAFGAGLGLVLSIFRRRR